MPVRRYADAEEDLAVAAASRAIAEATAILAEHANSTGAPLIAVPVDPTALGGGRAIGRPVVWEWIAALHAVRVKVASRLEEAGAPVPDDLPEASPLERLAGDPPMKMGSALLLGAVVVALLVAFVISMF